MIVITSISSLCKHEGMRKILPSWSAGVHINTYFQNFETSLKINASSMWDFHGIDKKYVGSVLVVTPLPQTHNLACFKWAKLKSEYFDIFYPNILTYVYFHNCFVHIVNFIQ